jgi:recombinational DNA repair ATPase RecF
MIESVTFHRFKQFADRTLELHPGVWPLGGGNNAGKSTILHGLAVWEFCRTAIEMERGAETFVAGQKRQGSGSATMSSRRSTCRRSSTCGRT